MAGQVGALRVTVGANITPLQTDMRRAQRVVAQSASSMERAVKGVNNSLTGLGTIAGVSLGGAGLLAAAAGFLKVADSAKSLRAQLKLATAEYGSFEQANKDVRRIAEQTRSDLLSTAELYAALQRNSGQLGATQEQVAQATQTVAQAFKISGAATSEQAAATRQLIQAFQSGVLRGDEFNSVMENAPRLSKLLADSLGTTIGQLRAMAEEGTLTADKLLKAFTDKKFTEGLNNEFRQLPVTFDEAMGQVYNSAVIVFSAFDRGGQFSNSIANFVMDGTEGFEKLEKKAYDLGEQLGDTALAIETIREGLASLKTEGIFAFVGLQNETYGWNDALADTLTGIDNIINAVYKLGTLPSIGLGRLFGADSFGELFGTGPLPDSVSDLRGGFDAKVIERELRERFGAAREKQAEGDVRLIRLTVQKAIEDINTKRASGQPIKQSEIDNLNRLTTTLEAGTRRQPGPFRPPPPKAKKTPKGRQPPRDRSDDVEFQFAQELRQAQMDVLRAQQSMAVTNEERARIALLLLDAEKAGKEAELNDRVRRAERDFAEKKITAGALEQVKIQADKLRAEYDSVDALERQAVADGLKAQKAEDAAELADADFDLRIEKLQLEGSLKETTSERLDVELRILNLMKEQERARLEATIADTEASETAKEIAKARLAELDAIYAGRADAARQGGRGPLADYKARYGDISEENEEAIVGGLEDMANALAQVTKGWDAMKEAARQALDSLVQALIRNQINQLFAMLIPSPAGFQAGGLAGFASGGWVSGPGTGTSDSIPAMLSNGEFVVNAKATKQFLPLLEGINTGMLPSFAGGGLAIPRASYGERVNISNDNSTSSASAPPFVFNNYAKMSAAEARQTGAQAAAGWRQEIARANRKGF